MDIQVYCAKIRVRYALYELPAQGPIPRLTFIQDWVVHQFTQINTYMRQTMFVFYVSSSALRGRF